MTEALTHLFCVVGGSGHTFRMTEPRGIAAPMGFGPSYRVLGSERDQVRRLGNAATHPPRNGCCARSSAPSSQVRHEPEPTARRRVRGAEVRALAGRPRHGRAGSERLGLTCPKPTTTPAAADRPRTGGAP